MNRYLQQLAASSMLSVLLVVFVFAGCLACAMPPESAKMGPAHPCCNPKGDCKPTHSPENNQLNCDIPDVGLAGNAPDLKIQFVALGPVQPFAVQIPAALVNASADQFVCPSPPDPLSQSSVLRI